MLKLFFILFVLWNVLCACVGQIVQSGQCDPEIPVLQNFTLEEFAGTWYEIKRTASPEQTTDCAVFEITDNDVTIVVHHYGVNNNFEEDYVGTVLTTGPSDPRLTLDVPIFDEPIDFWILLSFFDSFALAYSCKNISPNERSIHLWVLGRERAFATDLFYTLIDVHLNNWLNISINDLTDVNHSDVACYVLPFIEPGEEVILPGQCNDTIPVQQDFDVAAFTGTWHQIYSYYSNNSFGDCNRAQYTLQDGIVHVLNSEVVNQRLSTVSGTATLIGEDGSARLNVTLFVGPDLTPVNSELWVISTDYNNYAISYTCENLENDEKRIFSWILSRTREVNSTIQEQINEAIEPIIELNEIYYIPTDRSPEACFYFPEPNDQPVIFRGQCDVNIPAKADFEPDRYTGLWHNIELYPMVFQDGSCSNANYDLDDGIVNVFNTQVRNGTLDTIRGIAVIATDDGTAKLRVTFPIAGTDLFITTDYWVLDTNYTSYALVYSCTNLENDNMQVTAWKLSRSRTLTTEDSEAIDRAMNVSLVLDQQYFRVEDQTDEGCFFVPTPELGQPVVFPGQCDDSIYMSDFNLSEFEGTWYEIQSYPKEEQQGQCISYTYSAVSPTQLDMTTSSVYDQFRDIVNGTLTSNDGTGRLTISITSDNGTPLTIPFWIIDTNYTDYAVAYACVNRNDYYRAVWSWKLSRTTVLSPEAETAISGAIADIDILDNIYYEPIQHTAQACFYLPDLEPGEPIILNGQCDNSITGIANFNLTRFAAGRWKLIQSYPTDFQSGTCNEDIYTQLDEQTVSVTHTQVIIGQELGSNSTTASIANSNGNGILRFALPGSTDTFDYIILDTDYENYALAYGCENIGSTQRQVWSWKLSRGNALTDEENGKINEIIDSIEVLNNRYYYNVGRTETDCFYFPEVNDNTTSIRFRARCNESIPAVAAFNPGEYIGLWHDIQSYPQVFQQGTCINANYSIAGAAEVDVFNTQVINQQLLSILGRAALVSDDGSAKLNVTFEIGGFHDSSDYWVLATNYTSYAFVYSCREIDEEYIEVSSWKLSRSKTLSSEDSAAIDEVISTIPVLDQRYYRNIDQSEVGCFYFPEPEQGVPVLFPGQCDSTINTVPNFNLTQFEGTWHEIQAYPKDFQPGQCVNHQFSLISEPSPRFDLVSSSVFDQRLILTNSTVTGNDGKLNIAISTPSGPENIPFWIIDTDYTDYALAYSCVNQDNGFRSVYSWKLSRTRELSPDAVVAINNAMENIDVVDNRYFEPINQTDEACFYFPVVAPGEPVIFPGQCDTNIRGIANFSLSQFTDRWRLVAGYSQDGPRGDCIESEYDLIDSLTINATYTRVIDENLLSITGTAVHNSSDGSGVLQYTFPGNPDIIEYIILDTNYLSYAIVYSCVNIDDAYRRVTSWKLSRARTLSIDDDIKINEAISGIDVLDAQYYLPVEHTESSCFYFPEVNDNAPSIRFRARCNESIPAVAAFNPGEYIGLWHDIQSYPQVFQQGTCINANYSIAGAAEVDVFNTQVINQQLLSILGRAALVSDDGSAKLNVTFEVGGFYDSSDYWVLATNYTSYAFVYSCREIDEEYIEVSSWKLSRSKTLSNEDNAAINEVISTIPVLDQKYYRNIDQSEVGCFFFPEPEQGVPVVFPGQCDTNINTVTDFNFTQFEGTWHEIQAYPKDFQPGHCVNHQYSLISEPSQRFDLLSSSVLDQKLILTDSVVTGNDGKLNIAVTTPSGITNIPFWIIATDYTDYALAYSCVNEGNDFRAVYSWKLSRSRQLSSDGYEAINSAMQNIDVIDNRYFEPVQQTDDACFYLPDLGPNDPVTFRGQCDQNIPVVNDFDASRYLGRWRLIETYYSDFQNGTCIEASYLEGEDSVLVVNSQVVDEQLQVERGSAVLADTDGSGKLLVTFPSSPEPTEYWILATDYANYTLVYSCVNIGEDRQRVWSWKMSRTTTLTDDANEAINNVISGINVLNNQYYQSVNHTDVGCFYYPEPDVTRPVIFPGQCDMSIPAFPDFEPGRYLGFWYDIESYPEPFQNGTCPNANYTLSDDGTIRAENTQVVNQVKETWIGTAMIDTDDGSAKLNVTFNVNGMDVTSKYWVLDTDYNSYALVYSCSNIDSERRSVFSWKLSRSKTLSNEDNAAINQVISTIPVLEQRYYRNSDQSETGCFYFPEPEPGVPVVFPGQCDSNINTVTNFNFTQFEGTWHEIQAYPKDFQPGHCVNHQYSLISEPSPRFDLLSSSVLDQILILTDSVVTGNDGKLNIAVTTPSGITNIPFWIIATDYTDYALAYSCVNQGNDFRAVYSWKLSRSRQLSSDGYEAINSAMQNIDVIDNRYFEPVQQTDDACFYLPDLGPNEPVTFRGQCDQNIPVVSNFDASRYLGRWRLIETYYSDFQNGTCIEASYLEGEDSVLVVNSQVVDEQLQVDRGSAVLASTDGSGKLLVTFPSNPVPLEYWILATDYANYTLVYSCVNIGEDRQRVWSWKMSRTTTLTDDANEAINNVISGINVLNNRYYQSVNHTDVGCFYYPEPDVTRPVIFPGQCDMSIAALPDFEPERYLDFWYDIESYPEPFQTGTCQNANYTLSDDGTIRVENTQVLNQVKETWIGTAMIDTDDGSAKLNVTFNVNGMDVTSKYWVLATDYISYAFVYSCSNIDSDRRSVFSWKLSRSPTLTPDAIAAINAAIDRVQVLDQQYYINRDQSEDACFYYPDNNGGDVILPGQCPEDDEVLAVTNFNANAFARTWHEVSRFPSDLQRGECASNQFALSGSNAFTITQTFVYNERLESNNRLVSLPNATRGAFSVNIDDVPFDTVYILATDYNEYALAYSCRNRGSEYKQIYSWKLSNSRSDLSDAANLAIAEIVDSNKDLFDPYYRKTGQDYDSCFYYPVFETLPSAIELPGPCPSNIRGIENFNAQQYLGRWFETERYPVRGQEGQCVQSTYSVVNIGGEEGRLAVVNTEVVEETLLSRTGYAEPLPADGRGELEVVFTINGVPRTMIYYILATDYHSYSLLYSCVNLPNRNREVFSWKLSRTRTPVSSPVVDSVITNTQGLLQDYYQSSSQTDEDCFYIPFVNINQAPRFRGQCEDITGVEGFDVERYLGWWHEIERYPIDGTLSYIGECRSSEYSQDGNIYRVIDTKVQGNEATTATGTVTVTANGLLRRTVNDNVQDIWVLATDYDTYALLYSCQNIDDEYRQVWSAKHSKSRSLTDAAQTAMAPYITENRVLYSQFYQRVNQQDDVCFHYPDKIDGEVILPGQCDESIPVQEDFNMAGFGGAWYHVERYDPLGNDSVCAGTRFNIAENGDIHAIEFEVRDGELQTLRGTATVDGAKIDLTFPVAGSEDSTTTTVHILTTDYLNYALAYSCSNVGPFRRQVRAWKLSRARTWSADSSIAVNEIIRQREELHEPYFETIEQREDCPEPSSALIVKSSIIMLLVCALLQRLL